jgi:ABC-2 type transport system permease protein
MAFSLFMLVQFLANQFGFDRQGFRAYVLSPVDRRLVLLGKNLATWPVGAGFGLLLLTMLSFWLRLPILTALAAVFQLAILLLLGSLGGNLLSIFVPYRIQAGSMKPTKMPALPTLVMVLCQMLFPVVLAPVLLPALLEWLWHLAGGPAWVPVNLICSALLAGLIAMLYWRTLEPIGRLLQRREIKILNTVTAEQE